MPDTLSQKNKIGGGRGDGAYDRRDDAPFRKTGMNDRLKIKNIGIVVFLDVNYKLPYAPSDLYLSFSNIKDTRS